MADSRTDRGKLFSISLNIPLCHVDNFQVSDSVLACVKLARLREL